MPPALATPPGAGAVCDEAGARKIGRGAAEGFFSTGPVMVAHASLTARRLGLTPPPRSTDLMDVLEHPNAFLHPTHALDYMNVVQSWVRDFDHPHQVKGPFMGARFMNDTIRSNAMVPRDPKTMALSRCKTS